MRISDWSSDVCSSDLLANGVIGTINAACEHIPLLLMSGRTPATEQGRFGARTVPIAWGQEMRDQAAMIRERSEEHTSELQSLMRISYAVFCLKKKKTKTTVQDTRHKDIQQTA